VTPIGEIRNAKFGIEPEGNRLFGGIVLNGWIILNRS
jgi:hypothetical protein